ncbi:MAG: hypothetical protein WAQ33_01640 [Gaiellaceae bacterium]
MTKRIAGMLSAVVLTILLAAFTGSALAGNGNGKDNGSSRATPAAQPAPGATPSPGNSGNAPGHNKDSQASTQPGKGGGNQNSPSQTGVKPANNTAKGTSCVTGGKGSSVTCTSTGPTSAPAAGKADASKKYGNGKTAAQIATQNGAAPGTTLYGPGNSQPHKVVTCGHPHGVDVHALKGHANKKKCVGSSTSSKATTQTSSSTLSATGTGSTTHVGGTSAAAGASTPNGGVLGVTATRSGETGYVGGVLGALTTVGQGTLPFTGFPLWVAAAIALALIALGVGLRRSARATV